MKIKLSEYDMQCIYDMAAQRLKSEHQPVDAHLKPLHCYLKGLETVANRLGICIDFELPKQRMWAPNGIEPATKKTKGEV